MPSETAVRTVSRLAFPVTISEAAVALKVDRKRVAHTIDALGIPIVTVPRLGMARGINQAGFDRLQGNLAAWRLRSGRVA